MPLLKTDECADMANHPQDAGRERGIKKPQGPIPWAKARPARITVVVGAIERQSSQHTLEGLWPTPGKASQLIAGTRQGRSRTIRRVGIEPFFDSSRRHAHGLAPRGHFDGFEIPRIDWTPDKLVYLD
jgi:hypothetical protein